MIAGACGNTVISPKTKLESRCTGISLFYIEIPPIHLQNFYVVYIYILLEKSAANSFT